MAARMPMIVMVINNSISVKPAFCCGTFRSDAFRRDAFRWGVSWRVLVGTDLFITITLVQNSDYDYMRLGAGLQR